MPKVESREYLKRLKRGSKIELLYLKAGDSESVSAHLLERSKGTFRIALDERGQAWGTEELVGKDHHLGNGSRHQNYLTPYRSFRRPHQRPQEPS